MVSGDDGRVDGYGNLAMIRRGSVLGKWGCLGVKLRGSEVRLRGYNFSTPSLLRKRAVAHSRLNAEGITPLRPLRRTRKVDTPDDIIPYLWKTSVTRVLSLCLIAFQPIKSIVLPWISCTVMIIFASFFGFHATLPPIVRCQVSLQYVFLTNALPFRMI